MTGSQEGAMWWLLLVSIACLGLGTGFQAIPVLAWVQPFFQLQFVHRCRLFSSKSAATRLGLAVLAVLAEGIGFTIGSAGALNVTAHEWSYEGTTAVLIICILSSTVLFCFSYLIDAYYRFRFPSTSSARVFLFPTLRTALWALICSFSPLGSFNHPTYSQASSSLVLFSSLFGIHGICFLMSWLPTLLHELLILNTCAHSRHSITSPEHPSLRSGAQQVCIPSEPFEAAYAPLPDGPCSSPSPGGGKGFIPLPGDLSHRPHPATDASPRPGGSGGLSPVQGGGTSVGLLGGAVTTAPLLLSSSRSEAGGLPGTGPAGDVRRMNGETAGRAADHSAGEPTGSAADAGRGIGDGPGPMLGIGGIRCSGEEISRVASRHLWLFFGVLFLALVYGGGQPVLLSGTFYQRSVDETEAPTMRVACVLGEFENPGPQADWVLEQTAARAAAGDDLILWSETAMLIKGDQEERDLLSKVVRIALQAGQTRSNTSLPGPYIGVTYYKQEKPPPPVESGPESTSGDEAEVALRMFDDDVAGTGAVGMDGAPGKDGVVGLGDGGSHREEGRSVSQDHHHSPRDRHHQPTSHSHQPHPHTHQHNPRGAGQSRDGVAGGVHSRATVLDELLHMHEWLFRWRHRWAEAEAIEGHGTGQSDARGHGANEVASGGVAGLQPAQKVGVAGHGGEMAEAGAERAGAMEARTGDMAKNGMVEAAVGAEMVSKCAEGQGGGIHHEGRGLGGAGVAQQSLDKPGVSGTGAPEELEAGSAVEGSGATTGAEPLRSDGDEDDGYAAANIFLLIGPDGQAVFQYNKTHPVPIVEADVVPGPGVLPLVDTPYGKVSGAICFDLDFPDLIQQAGRNRVSLFLQPSWTWGPIGRFHFASNAFRAVENGFTLLRCSSGGYSGAVSSFHDIFFYRQALSKKVITAEVPLLPHRVTLYPFIGRLFKYILYVMSLVYIGLVLSPDYILELIVDRVPVAIGTFFFGAASQL